MQRCVCTTTIDKHGSTVPDIYTCSPVGPFCAPESTIEQVNLTFSVASYVVVLPLSFSSLCQHKLRAFMLHVHVPSFISLLSIQQLMTINPTAGVERPSSLVHVYITAKADHVRGAITSIQNILHVKALYRNPLLSRYSICCLLELGIAGS